MANDFVSRLLGRIRTLREAQCLSQEAFAERAGLKYKHYQAIEAGRKPKVQLPTVVKIAEALGLEPWQLLNFDIKPPTRPENPPLTDSGKSSPGTRSRAKRR